MIEEIRWKMLLQVGKILDKYRRDKIGKWWFFIRKEMERKVVKGGKAVGFLPSTFYDINLIV